MSERAFIAAVALSRRLAEMDMARPVDDGLIWADDLIKELKAENQRLHEERLDHERAV